MNIAKIYDCGPCFSIGNANAPQVSSLLSVYRTPSYFPISSICLIVIYQIEGPRAPALTTSMDLEAVLPRL